MTGSPPSCTDCPQLKISRRAFDCRENIFLFHRAVGQFIQKRVIALPDDWINGSQLDAILFAQLDHIFDQRVVHLADIERSGQGDRRFQRPQLIQLYQPERFSKAVDDLSGCGHLMYKRVFNWRQDYRHTGLILPTINRCMPDPYTGYVGNQVAPSPRQRPNCNPKV